MMNSLFHKLALYPTIAYTCILEYWGIRKWYTRIDETVVLGALPMKRNYEQILKDEQVKAVLTCNHDHELYYSIPKSEWTEKGVDYLQVPIEDYFGVASLDQIEKSVEFIKKHQELNQTVYVHCKAGRYRSALITACYLVGAKGMKPDEAVKFLKEKRSHVILDTKRQALALENYYNHLANRK